MLFVLFIIAASPVEAQVDFQEPAKPQSVAALIEQLGDRSFQTRQKATRELAKRGRKAVPELRIALKHENPEIRRRAKSILGKVLGTVTRDRFLADPTLANAKLMPGWNRLRLLFDSDELAIEAFGRWLRAEPGLFEAQVVGGREFDEELTRRAAFLTNFLKADATETTKQRQQLMDSVHATLFLVSTSADRPTSATDRVCESLFAIRVVAMQLMQSKSITFKLANEWVQVDGSQYPRLLLTLKYGLPAGLPLAEKIVRAKARGPRMEYALHVIGKLGGKKQIEVLKQQLTNTVRLSRRRSQAIRGPGGSRKPVNFEYQVRDIALAMLWHLNGEHPSDHGFGVRVREHRWFVFSPGSIGFASDEERDAAFAEWAKFVEAKKK